MLWRMVNGLRGQVRIRVECPFPERVLNLCSARGLSFWDTAWESGQVFSCRITRRDLARLRRSADSLDCTVTVLERTGMPFLLGRLRRRQVLAWGLFLCVLTLTAGSWFIWDFTIEGNDRVTQEEILRALEHYGVGPGSFGLGIDQRDLRNHVLLDLPELSWITVNVSGARAFVQVRERVPPPESPVHRQPTNVSARMPGLILEVRALEGVTMVRPGELVEKGRLLISGVEDTDTVGPRILPGTGEVMARTWHELTLRLPLTTAEKVYTGRVRTGWSLVLGRHRIKLFSNSSVKGYRYDKMIHRTRWQLFGMPLPVTTVRETFRVYETRPGTRTVRETEELGRAVLTDCLGRLVGPEGTIRSALCTSRPSGGALSVKLTAECVEDIGREVPIYTQDIVQNRSEVQVGTEDRH